jgi:hypothetical protein
LIPLIVVGDLRLFYYGQFQHRLVRLFWTIGCVSDDVNLRLFAGCSARKVSLRLQGQLRKRAQLLLIGMVPKPLDSL